MSENYTQAPLLENEYFQPELNLQITEQEKGEIVSELRKSVKGKLMRSYELELERFYYGEGIYSHRRVVNNFLNLLINNKDTVLINNGEKKGKKTYDESGWTIDSYELNSNGENEKQDFAINLQLLHPTLDDNSSFLHIPFNQEDFSDIEFFDGEAERDGFYDETVYELALLMEEGYSN